MAAASDYLENKLLDHVLRNTAYTSPTTVYVALFENSPADADTGDEIAGGSYVRKAATFDVAASGAITTSVDINYTGMPDTTADPITHFGIYDDVSAGNLLVHGAFASPKVTNAGDTLTIPAGDLDVTLA